MISKTYWTILEHANRELAQRFEKAKKARASGDARGIQQAEMDYFQALQRLIDDVQNAVADPNRENRL
ncbi:hypothetical protein C6499_22875 [Candidatus Poribacteria bacterium]|nr:MAG: hypothetical protein C6499_22875 [Candidatus Poribacteria bacterium]